MKQLLAWAGSADCTITSEGRHGHGNHGKLNPAATARAKGAKAYRIVH